MSSSYEPSIDQEIDHPEERKMTRYIKDPIHDYIPVSPLMSCFIDSRPFQRLREVKQLGTSHYVWPGACHSRFEHSIGVAFLARLMAEHLQKSQRELNITDRDVNCVELAGLCHDLGHGPWSHVWDGMFIPVAVPGSSWKHEDGSEMMFDFLVKENEIDLSENDRKFIKALISGDPSKCSPDEKPFLFDIVANKRNGLDVDKFDYIQRDSYMIGDPIRLSLPRIINCARVLDNQICYDIKDANQIYEICATRFKLHKIIYNHKAAKAIEYMLIDGLLAAEPYMNIARRVFDPEEYIHLTDNILGRIESTKEPELAKSRAILLRIRKRDLYRCVDYKVIDWPNRGIFREFITPERIVSAANNLCSAATTPVDEDGEEGSEDSGNSVLVPEDVIVDFSTMHYGMKERNPLDFIQFYSKRNPNLSRKACRGDYSNLMPQYFAEDLLRVYTKKPEYFGLVQAGYRRVLESMVDLPTSPLSLPASISPLDPRTAAEAISFPNPSPPATEPPSTPRANSHSRAGSFTFSANGSADANAFTNNSFTTVAKDYSLTPSQMATKPRGSAKRAREREGSVDTPRKRTAT